MAYYEYVNLHCTQFLCSCRYSWYVDLWFAIHFLGYEGQYLYYGQDCGEPGEGISGCTEYFTDLMKTDQGKAIITLDQGYVSHVCYDFCDTDKCNAFKSAVNTGSIQSINFVLVFCLLVLTYIACNLIIFLNL